MPQRHNAHVRRHGREADKRRKELVQLEADPVGQNQRLERDEGPKPRVHDTARREESKRGVDVGDLGLALAQTGQLTRARRVSQGAMTATAPRMPLAAGTTLGSGWKVWVISGRGENAGSPTRGGRSWRLRPAAMSTDWGRVISPSVVRKASAPLHRRTVALSLPEVAASAAGGRAESLCQSIYSSTHDVKVRSAIVLDTKPKGHVLIAHDVTEDDERLIRGNAFAVILDVEAEFQGRRPVERNRRGEDVVLQPGC